MPKVLRNTVGAIELIISALFGYAGIGSTYQVFFPPPWPEGEWAILGALVFLPISVSFGTAGLALVRNWNSAWRYQMAPGIVIVALSIFFYFADSV